MLIWNITAKGHGGFTLTDRVAAEHIRDILNAGTLYPGGTATLETGRAPKNDEPRPLAVVAEAELDDAPSHEVLADIDEAVATVRSPKRRTHSTRKGGATS